MATASKKQAEGETGMETFKIYRWDTGAEIASAEAETLKDALEKLVARKVDLSYAELNDAELNDAELNGAKLNGAKLNDAKLNGAKLNYAKLNYAELNGAELNGAELNDAKLNGAKLNYAKLNGAELNGAKLSFIKHDLWAVLLHARNEVAGLTLALQQGRVDGSVYEGECACLVGTIANVRHCKHTELLGLAPDSSRPAEVWFLGIKKGDTAEKNEIVKITLDWIAEFQGLLAAERGGGTA